MGIMDKFSKFLNAPVEEDEDYGVEEPSYKGNSRYDDDYENVSSNSRSSGRGYDYGYSRGEQSRSGGAPYGASGERRSKVVNLNSGTQLQMVLVKPERFEDGISIADHLNAKRTVVLNLESASREVTRRLVDFLSGVAYANDGQLKRVANSTFVITPNNVDVMGDVLLEELESGSYHY